VDTEGYVAAARRALAAARTVEDVHRVRADASLDLLAALREVARLTPEDRVARADWIRSAQAEIKAAIGARLRELGSTVGGMTDDDLRDLDETRRLAYVALAAARLERHHELVGTLVNALAHHGIGVEPGVAMDKLCALVEPTGDAATIQRDQRDAQDWLRDMLGILNRRIDAD
jgi:hypothetical protein